MMVHAKVGRWTRAGAIAAILSASTQARADPLPAAPASGELRLRDVEARLNELSDHVRRSRTQLSLLADTLFGEGEASSRLKVGFVSELSGAFEVTRLLVVLDGAVQYRNADDEGVVHAQGSIPIFDGSVPAGEHTLHVVVNLRGNGYGMFSYLRGYRFEVRSTHSFTLVEGKALTLSIASYEKGTVTTPLEERPSIRFGESVEPIKDPARRSREDPPAKKP